MVLLERLGSEHILNGPLIRYGDVFLFGFLQWMKFGILAQSHSLLRVFPILISTQ